VKRSVSKVKQKKKRGHAVLDPPRIMKAFGLKMSDMPEAISYLRKLYVDNALQLPTDLTSRQIRLIGAGACIDGRSGFSLGDITLWVLETPNPAVTPEEFTRMVLKTPLERRTFDYNYPSLSRGFPPETRHPTLSRVHHESVRTMWENRREQRRLLDLAFNKGWTPRELKKYKDKAMNGAGSVESVHRQELQNFESAESRVKRIAPLVKKPDRTIEETVKLERELTALIREFSNQKELLSQGPPPL
jgi:hypothetical protein